MKIDEIFSMAQHCWPSNRQMWAVDAELPRLQRFAELVAQAEREACAKVCDSVNNYDNPMTASDCADAIRARS